MLAVARHYRKTLSEVEQMSLSEFGLLLAYLNLEAEEQEQRAKRSSGRPGMEKAISFSRR